MIDSYRSSSVVVEAYFLKVSKYPVQYVNHPAEATLVRSMDGKNICLTIVYKSSHFSRLSVSQHASKSVSIAIALGTP